MYICNNISWMDFSLQKDAPLKWTIIPSFPNKSCHFFICSCNTSQEDMNVGGAKHASTDTTIHRVIEWFGLEETFKDHLVQPCATGRQGHFSLDQVAQSPIQPDFEQFQWWGIHNFSGQCVPVSYYPHPKKILPCAQSKSAHFQFKTVAPCPVTTGHGKKCLSIFCKSSLSIERLQ